MFAGRNLVIATKHQKEKVIAPLLENQFKVKCIPAAGFDTDELGTFTGEIERKDDPVTTLRKKCLIAMEKTNCDLGIASEGSFGPHPALVFVNADDELMMLIDKRNNLEIIARELSTETNFNGREIKDEKNLVDFAVSVLFPSHALIMREERDGKSKLVKGIHDWELLKHTFQGLINEFGTAYAETDMRAMHNPTRMKVIKRATEKLIEKTMSFCPQCGMPGFGITDARRGLPCSLCGSQTQSTLSHLYVCSKCNHAKEILFPNEKKTEDPMYCDVCNP